MDDSATDPCPGLGTVCSGPREQVQEGERECGLDSGNMSHVV